MKNLILLLLIFFIDSYAENIKYDNCTNNGYRLDEIISVEKTLQKSLKTNDRVLLAEQFIYPFRVNLPNGKIRIISSKRELIEKFSLIYNQKEVQEMIAEKDLSPFCKSDGAAIFGGMWLANDNNDNKMKVFAINASENAKISGSEYGGIPVLSVSDLNSLTTFVDMYNRGVSKVESIQTLRVGGEWKDKRTLVSSHPDYNSAFLLYHVDINNDGQLEWVLVYPCEGSMCTSGIAGVYKNRDGMLQPIPFNNLIISDFNLPDMSRWYLFIYDPLFTRQRDKILIHFYNSRPAQICSYLWQNNKISLVHGDTRFCIHSS